MLYHDIPLGIIFKRVAVVERLKLNNVPRETNHRIVSRGTLPLLWFID